MIEGKWKFRTLQAAGWVRCSSQNKNPAASGGVLSSSDLCRRLALCNLGILTRQPKPTPLTPIPL
jgi:hypothetical protein